MPPRRRVIDGNVLKKFPEIKSAIVASKVSGNCKLSSPVKTLTSGHEECPVPLHHIPEYTKQSEKSNMSLNSKKKKPLQCKTWLEFFKQYLFWFSIFILLNGCLFTNGVLLYFGVVRGSPVACGLLILYSIWFVLDYQTPKNAENFGKNFFYTLPRRVMSHLFECGRQYFDNEMCIDEQVDLQSSSCINCLITGSVCVQSKLVHTTPTVFACHPHGVLPLGPVCAFGIDRLVNRFGGFPIRWVTLSVQFLIPFWREIFLIFGSIDSSKTSLRSFLSNKQSLILSVGGAAEAVLTRPGVIEVLISEKSGFIRLAIQEGVYIRPVITFGEDKIFWVARWRWIRFLHRLFLKHLYLPIPIIFWGRSWWPWLVVPPAQKLKVVVGKPMLASCAKIENPSAELIESFHAKYTQELVDLFTRHSPGDSVLVLS